jgi:hypothetical protein
MSATNTDRVCDGQRLPDLASYHAEGFRQPWVLPNLRRTYRLGLYHGRIRSGHTVKITDNPDRKRSENIQLARRLTYITLDWITTEGAGSLLLGSALERLLLEAFGIDLCDLDKSNVCLPLVKSLEVDLCQEEANRSTPVNKNAKRSTSKKAMRSAVHRRKKRSAALGRR